MSRVIYVHAKRSAHDPLSYAVAEAETANERAAFAAEFDRLSHMRALDAIDAPVFGHRGSGFEDMPS